MGSSRYQRRSGIRHRTWCRMSFQETHGLRFVCTRIGSSPFRSQKSLRRAKLWILFGVFKDGCLCTFGLPFHPATCELHVTRTRAARALVRLCWCPLKKRNSRRDEALLYGRPLLYTYISGSSGSFTTSLIDWLTDLMTKLMCAGKLQFKAKLISFSTQFASTLGLRNHLQ